MLEKDASGPTILDRSLVVDLGQGETFGLKYTTPSEARVATRTALG